MRFSLHGSIVVHVLLMAMMGMGAPSNLSAAVQFNVDYASSKDVLQTVVGVELEGVGHGIYGGGLYSQMIFDESFEDANDHVITSPIVSFHPEAYPDVSFRHCNSQLYCTSFAAGGPPDDHYFHVDPALNGKKGFVSLRSVNFPTFYIGPVAGLEPGRLGTINGPTDKNAVSFQLVDGIGNKALKSLKSMDGKYATLTQKLTGVCAPYYKAPGGDMVLLALADIQSAKLEHSATFNLIGRPNVTTVVAGSNPSLSLRHCNSELFVTALSAGGPPDDHHFIIVPGLNGVSGYASFQSVNYPTFYIGPALETGLEPGRLGTQNAPKNLPDVSFEIVKSLDGNPRKQSIKSVDGRYFTLNGQLKGDCAQYYHSPASDVVLMSLADIQKNKLIPQAAWKLSHKVEGNKHWSFTGGSSVKCTGADAFNGACSAQLASPSSTHANADPPRMINSGLYHRGLNITKATFQGYVFLKKNSGASAKITVGVYDGRKGGNILASQVFTVTSPKWTMFNITLASTGDAKGAGSFFVELGTPGSSVGVDMVFLEPGSWGLFEGLHLRKDVAEAVLLGGGLQSIRLDGSSILNSDWRWEAQRGPAWARPAIYGDWWYHAMSGGFGMFEALQLAEKGNLAYGIIGLCIENEDDQSAGDLVEYLYGNASTPMGKLRASDGHPAPYMSNVIIELGNEEAQISYINLVIPLMKAMRARLQQVAPAQLKTVKFGIALYSNVWATGDIRLKTEMLDQSAEFGDMMMWDLHSGGSSLTDAAGAFGTVGGMVKLFNQHGWKQQVPIFIGETNCAVSRGDCSGLARGLLSALYFQEIVRDGRVATLMPAVWGYSTCDEDGTICGATDGGYDWPQEALIITQGDVIRQPSWWARAMVGAVWGKKSMHVTPDTQSCMPSGIISILALEPDDGKTVNFQIVNTCTAPQTISIALKGKKYCDTTFKFDVLGGVDLNTFNNVANPSNLVPVEKSGTVDSAGNAQFALPKLSLAVAKVCVQ